MVAVIIVVVTVDRMIDQRAEHVADKTVIVVVMMMPALLATTIIVVVIERDTKRR